MESMQRHGKAPTPAPGIDRVLEDLQSIHEQIVKVTDFQRSLYSSFQLMRETLERKGVISIADWKGTEDLYRAQKTLRDSKIKEILSSSMTDFDKVDVCMKEILEYKHGYEKLNLNPVRDLNVPPPVVNEYLMTKHYQRQDYLRLADALGVPETMQVKEDVT